MVIIFLNFILPDIMKNKFSKFFIYLLTLNFLFYLLFLPVASQAAPNGDTFKWTIPDLQIDIGGLKDRLKNSQPTECGVDAQGNTKYCIPWIGQYIAGVYQYAIGIVGILSAVVLMFGGIIWLTAGGNAAQIGNAKAWIGASLTGLVIALCSYMILYLVNPDLTIFKPLGIKLAKYEGPAAPKAGALGEGAARTLLTQASQSSGSRGIGIKPACPANGPYTNCVNLLGINSTTLNEIINLSKICTTCAAYEVFITGGTEPGHSDNGTYTHANGYKVDLRSSTNLDNYIKNNFTKIETRSDGAEQWQALDGAIYAYETSGGAHWDITVK